MGRGKQDSATLALTLIYFSNQKQTDSGKQCANGN